MTTLATTRPMTSARATGLFSRLRKAAALARQRHALAALDYTRLRDIGLTRAPALPAAGPPFGHAPPPWRGCHPGGPQTPGRRATGKTGAGVSALSSGFP